MESTALRTIGIESVSSIVLGVPQNVAVAVLQPILKGMLESVGSAAMRGAGILLFAETIQIMPSQVQGGLFRATRALATDPSVRVRRSFAQACSKFVHHLKGAFAATLLSSVTTFADDDCFLVCSPVPQFLVEYVKVSGNVDSALKIGEKLLGSPHWETRCEYVKELSSIFGGQTIAFSRLYPILATAVMDPELEVRIAGAEQLPLFATLQDIDTEQITNVFASLLSNSSPHVKTSTAKALPLFAKSLRPDFIANSLLEMTKDGPTEVRITAVDALKSPHIPIPVKIECIQQALTSTQWRERDSLVSVVSDIYTAKEGPGFLPVITQLLFDDACDVRKAMLAQLPGLLAKGKSDLENRLLEEIRSKIQESDYQMRQTALVIILKTDLKASAFGREVIERAIEDPVANVRLSLALNIPKGRGWEKAVSRLRQDADEDVRDAASGP
jgi:HEAT repeat protein